MPRTPLPVELQGIPFHVRDALRAGMPAARTRRGDLRAPHHGVRSPADAPADSVAERAALLLPRLSGAQFFSHSTAAALWGMPVPPRCLDGPLHVGAVAPAREPRIDGVTGHRIRTGFDRLTLASGMPVPAPAVVWTQLGSELYRAELLAAADHLLRTGLADRLDLFDAVAFGMRGAVTLRETAELARAGSESPPESETRLVLLDGGLPEPDLNIDLRDGLGRFVARLDMAYPRYRVAVEYDGRQHADHHQFARDADRWAAIAAEGWTLIRVLSHHLDHPGASVVVPVRRALLRAGWRPAQGRVSTTRRV